MATTKVKKEESEDLEDIMRDRLVAHRKDLELHESEEKAHAEKAKFHRERVAYITDFLKNLPPRKNGRESLALKEQYTKIWFWEKNAPDFAKQYFPDQQFITGQLLDAVTSIDESDEEYRKKCIYALSFGLGNLVQEGIFKSEKVKGIRGYYYKLIK